MSLISTAAYSFATQVYSQDEIEEIVSLCEGYVSIGNVIGPFLGSIIFYLTSFEATQFFFGSLMVPLAFVVLATLSTPKAFKESTIVVDATNAETEPASTLESNDGEQERLTYWKLLKS